MVLAGLVVSCTWEVGCTKWGLVALEMQWGALAFESLSSHSLGFRDEARSRKEWWEWLPARFVR